MQKRATKAMSAGWRIFQCLTDYNHSIDSWSKAAAAWRRSDAGDECWRCDMVCSRMGKRSDFQVITGLACFNLWDQPVREQFILQPRGLWKTKRRSHQLSISSSDWHAETDKKRTGHVKVVQVFFFFLFFTHVAGWWLQLPIKAGLGCGEAALLVRMFAVERHIFSMRNHGICNVKRPALHSIDHHTASLSRDETASCGWKYNISIKYTCMCMFF